MSRRDAPLPQPPAGLAAPHAERLLELLDEARSAQRHEAARALDDALRHIPRLLRPAVRRALG